jgi:hypothetical protein
MSSDYLKKPMLSKKIEMIKRNRFTLTTCEMQGNIRSIQVGEGLCKMQVYLYN